MPRGPVGGQLGEATARALIEALTQLKASGTLLLEHEAGSRLLLLVQGVRRADYTLGAEMPLDVSGGRFTWHPHPPALLPQLPARFVGSQVAALSALPDVLVSADRLVAHYVDFRALLAYLAEAAFTGVVVLVAEPERGVLLYLAGRLGGALYEAPGLVRYDLDALRRMHRHSGSPQATLLLRPLPEPITAALLGLARNPASDADPHTFSGVEASEAGYCYYQCGTPYLIVEGELVGSSGFYPSLEDPPHLTLPHEPPGWEQKRYRLTLRGRDALNPMTDLAMDLGRRFDTRSRNLLRQLARGATLEQIAEESGVDLGALRPRLERLLQEGLIREAQD